MNRDELLTAVTCKNCDGKGFRLWADGASADVCQRCLLHKGIDPDVAFSGVGVDSRGHPFLTSRDVSTVVVSLADTEDSYGPVTEHVHDWQHKYGSGIRGIPFDFRCACGEHYVPSRNV